MVEETPVYFWNTEKGIVIVAAVGGGIVCIAITFLLCSCRRNKEDNKIKMLDHDQLPQATEMSNQKDDEKGGIKETEVDV